MSGQLQASTALASGRRGLVYPFDRRLDGPGIGLYDVEEREISLSCRESNPDSWQLSP
jgi:hypothetical protein